MTGRAGRAGLDDRGDAYVMLPEESFESYKQRYQTIPPITSQLKESDILLFHTVAEMDASNVRLPEDLVRWHARSLAAQQGNAIDQEQAEEVFELLLKCHAIREMPGGGYASTALGKISSWLYFDPRNVWWWACNLLDIANGNLWENDACLAFAIGSIPIGTLPYVPRDLEQNVLTFVHDLATARTPAGLKTPMVGFPGAVESWALWEALRGFDPKEHTPLAAMHVRMARGDIERQMTAIKLIDSMFGHWGKEADWEVFSTRVRYSIGKALVPLVRLPGIGGVRAKKLWDVNVRSLAAVANPKNERLVKVTLGAGVGASAIDAARRLL